MSATDIRLPCQEPPPPPPRNHGRALVAEISGMAGAGAGKARVRRAEVQVAVNRLARRKHTCFRCTRKGHFMKHRKMYAGEVWFRCQRPGHFKYHYPASVIHPPEDSAAVVASTWNGDSEALEVQLHMHSLLSQRGVVV